MHSSVSVIHHLCCSLTGSAAACDRDVVSSHEAVTMARADFKRRRDAQQIAERLVRVALQRRTEDNISVVVVDLGGGKDGWVKPKGKNSDKLKSMFGMSS